MQERPLTCTLSTSKSGAVARRKDFSPVSVRKESLLPISAKGRRTVFGSYICNGVELFPSCDRGGQDGLISCISLSFLPFLYPSGREAESPAVVSSPWYLSARDVRAWLAMFTSYSHTQLSSKGEKVWKDRLGVPTFQKVYWISFGGFDGLWKVLFLCVLVIMGITGDG